MEKLICDSSFLINVTRLGLKEILAEHMRLSITPAVYDECVEKPRSMKLQSQTGERIALNVEQGKLQLLGKPATPFDAGFGRGETEVIASALTQNCAVGIDDFSPARYLVQKKISVVHTPTAVVWLFKKGHLTRDEAQAKLRELSRWFSNEAVQAAQSEVK